MQLHVNDVAFRGNPSLLLEVTKLETPLEFFSYFFTDELLEMITLETNRAAHMENINTKFAVDSGQIRRYIGVLIFMSIFRYPNIELYCSEFGFRKIPDCIARNKFEAIKKYLTMNPNAYQGAKQDMTPFFD